MIVLKKLRGIPGKNPREFKLLSHQNLEGRLLLYFSITETFRKYFMQIEFF